MNKVHPTWVSKNRKKESHMKTVKKSAPKEPLMVKKTKFSDYEVNRKKSTATTEDYQDFGKLERKPEKSKRWDNKERRSKEGA